MDDNERRIRRRLRDDFAAYAYKCLKIRAKDGSIQPLHLNAAQLHLHSAAETQLRERGNVRIIVLKGRQQGVSTYIEGRGYWRTTHRRGYRTSIMTHMADATSNLFGMARRYHQHCPDLVRAHTDSESAKTLRFDALDSDYQVATAGTSGAGRGATVQFFHASEVAFWPNAQEHAAGILQAVPDAPSTEVYYESTACGEGNYFHKVWQAAIQGVGDFEAVFIPWYWQPEYTRVEKVELDDDEIAYAEQYGLTEYQMAWRRQKIFELGDAEVFRQEYPATASEAFLSSEGNALLSMDLVERAIHPGREVEPVGPKVMALDVARFGDDRNAATLRQGRVIEWVKTWSKADTMDTTGRFKVLLDEHQPDRAFVDVVGIGAGVVDRLREMGYHNVVAASAGERALDQDKYPNRRNEMFGELRSWLADGPVKLPNDEELRADLAGLRIKRYDSKGRLQLETKDEAKSRGIRSPDLADAIALTFYEPVGEWDFPEIVEGSSWMS